MPEILSTTALPAIIFMLSITLTIAPRDGSTACHTLDPKQQPTTSPTRPTRDKVSKQANSATRYTTMPAANHPENIPLHHRGTESLAS